ncbi:hypothetical protein D3C84_1260870 [compost metagenome]
MQALPRQFDALQAQARFKNLLLALPVLHGHLQFLVGSREAHAVLQIAWQEGRDVETLGHPMA